MRDQRKRGKVVLEGRLGRRSIALAYLCMHAARKTIKYHYAYLNKSLVTSSFSLLMYYGPFLTCHIQYSTMRLSQGNDNEAPTEAKTGPGKQPYATTLCCIIVPTRHYNGFRLVRPNRISPRFLPQSSDSFLSSRGLKYSTYCRYVRVCSSKSTASAWDDFWELEWR